MELPNGVITDTNQVLWKLSLILEVMYNDSALDSDLGRPLQKIYNIFRFTRF